MSTQRLRYEIRFGHLNAVGGGPLTVETIDSYPTLTQVLLQQEVPWEWSFSQSFQEVNAGIWRFFFGYGSMPHTIPLRDSVSLQVSHTYLTDGVAEYSFCLNHEQFDRSISIGNWRVFREVGAKGGAYLIANVHGLTRDPRFDTIPIERRQHPRYQEALRMFEERQTQLLHFSKNLIATTLHDFVAKFLWIAITPDVSDLAAPAQPDALQERLSLPPVTDPTDQRILEWVTADPDLTDSEIAQRLIGSSGAALSRQAVNVRRKRLQAMGYKVR